VSYVPADLLELSRAVTLDEGGLSHTTISDKDEFEARRIGSRLLQSARGQRGGGLGNTGKNKRNNKEK
jgi:hypothetical protein